MPLLDAKQSDIDAFIRHPRTFMKDCVAELGFQGAKLKSGAYADQGDIEACGALVDLTFKQDPGWTVYQSTKQLDDLGQVIKRTLKFFKIVRSVPGEPSFKAFYCPYVDGGCLGVTVGPAANFMFTPLQNGCTLGIGSAAPDGSRLVFHANARNVANNVIGQRAQLNTAFGGAGIARMWEKTSYMSDMPGLAHLTTYQLNATSFGVRSKTGNWHFYSQIHEKVPGPNKIYLRGVKSMQNEHKGYM